MSDLIKKIKIKKQDGTYTDYIPIGAEAKNVDCSDGESVEYKLNKKPYYYNSIADMKADTNLKVGDMAVTLGYYEPNDEGAAEYKIVNGIHTDDGGSYHLLENNLYAELIETKDIIATQWGVIADSKQVYGQQGWEFIIGTDYGDRLNELLALKRPIILPQGVLYITKPLKLYSNSIIKGQNDMYSTRIIFNGNNDESVITTYNPNNEVSFLEVENIRLTDIRNNASSGYAINIEFADNHVLLHHLFIDHFPNGGIYIGSSITNKAGDNIIIDDIWGVIKNTTNSLITVGNFNNVCTISNIFCDGGRVFSRTAHGYNIGIINIMNVKHEVHSDQTGTASINIGNTDYIICNSIMRRNTPATTPEQAGYILNNISTRGVYMNCHVAYGPAPANGRPFPELQYKDTDGTYFQELSPVNNVTKYTNYNGSAIYAPSDTFPVGKIGDLAFNGEKLYQKATTAGTNTGWLPLDVRRVYQSRTDIPHFHIEPGESVYILDDHKMYWLDNITSTRMYWYDAAGQLAFTIDQ